MLAKLIPKLSQMQANSFKKCLHCENRSGTIASKHCYFMLAIGGNMATEKYTFKQFQAQYPNDSACLDAIM
jgi:hypothetical protein